MTTAFGLLNSACSTNDTREVEMIKSKSGHKIRRITENTWSPAARVAVRKNSDMNWAFYEIVPGESTVIRLSESDFMIGSFDGLSFEKVTIQLPSLLEPGQTYSLDPIPQNRKVSEHRDRNELAGMRDGELTALKFGNPLWASLERVEVAEVRIVSVGKKAPVIHLRLRADLGGGFAFDLDREYTLKLKNLKTPD